MHANPKEAERVQTDCHADVVYDAAPEITGRRSDVALLIRACSLHYDRTDAQQRFQPSILKDSSLDRQECVWIGDIDLGQDVIQGPEMMYGGSSVGQNDQFSFATDVVDQKLEEGVDGESL